MRMSSAVLGIYGNSKEEANYPAYFVDAERKPLDGGDRPLHPQVRVGADAARECLLVTDDVRAAGESAE
jgi:hypothetical protein